MKLVTCRIVILFLLALSIICYVEATTKSAASTKSQKLRKCRKQTNGQHLCYCGENQMFDRLKGEQCVDGKVVPTNVRGKILGLRSVTTPIYRSTRNESELSRCTGLFIKPPKNSNNQTFVPLRNVSVEAWIDSFAADVTLTQVFVNREENPIEAIYVFPIEENAAVYSFTAEIDNRTITAVLKEKKAAENEYESAIEQGQTAVLMRQSKETLDTFTVNVGALPPGKECRVKIQYVTELELVNGNSIRFVVPTTIAPRYNPSLGHLQTPDRTEAEYVQKTPYSMWFQAHVLQSNDYKIMQVANLSHPVNVSVKRQSIDVSCESIALDRDIILDIDLPTNRPMTSVAIEKYNGSSKHAVLLSFTPSLADILKISSEHDETNTEFIFIVDCSGSMTEANGIGLAKEAMLLFIRSLPVGANFNIIRFGSRYDVLFKDEGLTAVYDEKTAKEAENLTRSMEANFGGTELLEPLQYLKERPPVAGRSRQIFLLTDGEISNTNEVIDLCRSMSSTTRIFSFGLGYSPSRALVKGLARATNGYFVFVPPNSKVDTYVGSQFGRALQPAIVNAQLQWHGLSSNRWQTPRTVPPLYVDDRVLVYELLEDPLSTENVRVDLIVKGKTISSIKLPQNVTQKRDTIRRLAAKALIQELQHQKTNTEKNENETTLEQRIRTLSLDHQILSPYTAFVGVETTGPKINTTNSKVRHVPIQISKGDEHLFNNPFGILYSRGGSSGRAYGYSPRAMAGMPMSLGSAGYARSSTRHPIQYRLTGRLNGPPAMYDSFDSDVEMAAVTTTVPMSTDPVRWLIDQQSFNGGWLLNDQDIQKLTKGKTLHAFPSTVTNTKEALTTALAIAVLESKHADQKNLWNAVVGKARKRLSKLGLTDNQINTLINEMKNKL